MGEKNNINVKIENHGVIPKEEEHATPEELYSRLIDKIKRYHPSAGDLSAIDKAYNFAKKSHGDQKRKSGEPYIIHPIHTALILADLELDKESIMAGLLHDVMEDTKVTREQMIELTACLKEEFDYVIIDCPAGIEQGFKNAIAGATKAIVVTTPEVSSIRDADRIIGLLEKDGIEPIYLLVNKLRPELIRRGDMMSSEDVVDILGTEIIGCVNDDINVVIATNRGEAVVDLNTVSGKSITKIAEKLCGVRGTEDKTESRISFWFIRNIFSRGESR